MYSMHTRTTTAAKHLSYDTCTCMSGSTTTTALCRVQRIGHMAENSSPRGLQFRRTRQQVSARTHARRHTPHGAAACVFALHSSGVKHEARQTRALLPPHRMRAVQLLLDTRRLAQHDHGFHRVNGQLSGHGCCRHGQRKCCSQQQEQHGSFADARLAQAICNWPFSWTCCACANDNSKV